VEETYEPNLQEVEGSSIGIYPASNAATSNNPGSGAPTTQGTRRPTSQSQTRPTTTQGGRGPTTTQGTRRPSNQGECHFDFKISLSLSEEYCIQMFINKKGGTVYEQSNTPSQGSTSFTGTTRLPSSASPSGSTGNNNAANPGIRSIMYY
jgi:hypothetical protein